jgi:hypothetical protein
MSRFLQVVAVAVLSLSAGTAAVAQTQSIADEAKDPPAGEAVDAEEDLDNGLKRFGFLAGLAHGCVTDAQRPLLQREAIDIHAGISRLMGSDRAFLFSSAYGYGTNMKIDVKECPEVLKNYDERVAKHRAAGGGAK